VSTLPSRLRAPFAFVDHYPKISYSTTLFGNYTGEKASLSKPGTMSNNHIEWSLEDDRILFQNGQKSIPELAAITGRGLRGVETRLSALNDSNSSAYARLVAHNFKQRVESVCKKKLIPASEVLRHVQWDQSLSISDFSIAYCDCNDDIVELSMGTTNTSSDGSENLLVFSIPEHRISFIKYKQRIVWDKENQVDLVFGFYDGTSETIQDVIKSYEEWNKLNEVAEQRIRKRQNDVSSEFETLLGGIRFKELNEILLVLLGNFDETDMTSKVYIESYVHTALQLFREACNENNDSGFTSAVDFLDLLSQLAALLPHPNLRKDILSEISIQNFRLDGKNSPAETKKTASLNLPKIKEEDIKETFVRGSGAGGQKVNKTNNKVVLLHEPTQLRVECHETRSLQQNRKIARKRMRQKLDAFLNGNQSIANQKRRIKSSKKAKAKARNKVRQRKKQESQNAV